MFKLLSLYSDTGPETSSPFVGLVRRLSFCVVRHQRSSRAWPLAGRQPRRQPYRLLHLGPCTASCIPEAGERCGSTEAAPDRGLVWPAADRCRWGNGVNRRMEKTSPGVCSSKGAAVWFYCNFWVWCRFNSSNFVNIIMFNDLYFVTYVVSLEYYRAVASAVGATGKPQLVLCS